MRSEPLKKAQKKYLKTRKGRIAKAKKRKKHKRNIKIWFKQFKNKLLCEICGETENCCLDFHHKNPMTKKSGIGLMVANGDTKTTILREIDKCTVVCSNCHRKIHAK